MVIIAPIVVTNGCRFLICYDTRKVIPNEVGMFWYLQYKIFHNRVF